VSPRPLQGQVGIVTGAGKGLGRAFALDLAAAGAAVVVNNRNRTPDADGRGPAEQVVAEITAAGGTGVAESSDVGDPEAAQRLVRTALETYGRLDFLVTSAAVSNPELFHKTTPERFAAVLDVNIAGTVRIAHACTLHMRAAEHGRIVLVGSTAGLHGEPTAPAYATSKGAVIALGRTIAVEGARRGVFTNVLLPYATTQMTDAGMAPQYRDAMTAESVAPVVTALVDPRSTINGQVLVAGGGALRAAAAVEYGTVPLPGRGLASGELADLLARSREVPGTEFPHALAGFLDFAGAGAAAP
jgi:NAD(P)-dependent dehydrogenase (short-subunit alcohol dehydrogenase family)